MAGGLLEFARSAEGQGLLSAIAGGMAGARQGQPWNTAGRGLLAGVAGYGNALDRETQLAENAFNKQYRTAQMTKLEQDIASGKSRAEYLSGLSGASTHAPTPGAQAGGNLPPGLQKIPQSAIQADIALNGGKNIAEWMFKMGVPDMQVSNGYAYDKNSTAPGFMPQMSVSNDGKATQVTVGPNGMPVVSAPTGALDTYNAFLAAQEDAKAKRDLVTVPTSDGRVRTMPRSEALGATSGNSNQAQVSYPTQGNARMTPDLLGLIQADAAKNGIANPVINLNSAIPGQTFGLANPAQIGVQQSDAEKVAAAERAKAEEAAAAATQKDRVTARKFINQAKKAEALLLKNPTGSLGGSLIDQTLGALGYTTDAANTAQELKAVSGWLVSNTPRMEGPQSNFDVTNYQTMAADVGNDKLPVERRLAALRQVMSMLEEVSGEPRGQPGTPNDRPAARKVVRTGMYNGRKVVQYDDGSTGYAN